MIRITRKEDCCGCLSCVQACPQNCIKTITDEQGFQYPKVNESICVDCGACEKVCPIINADNHTTLGKDTLSYACYNTNDEVRKNSSSGGFFTLIAEYVIRKQGVVFGAKFDKDLRVVHSYTETIEGIEDFRRSKYVQSYIGESYKHVRSFLKDDRLVLFTGTPCQIAGLKQFLRREYDNLICLDVVCHGVPSPAIWDKYLKEKKTALSIENHVDSPDKIEITRISFRDKTNGWRKYSLAIYYKIKDLNYDTDEKSFVEYIWDNDYMLCFLKDFINRPSCFECKFRNGRSHSDITMADFWGVERILTDENYAGEKGTSLLLINNPKAKNVLEQLDMERLPVDFIQARNGNPAIYRNLAKPFFHDACLNALDKRDLHSAYLKYSVWEERFSDVSMFLKRVNSRIKRIWQKLA